MAYFSPSLYDTTDGARDQLGRALPVLIAPPLGLVVSLDEAKRQVVAEDDDRDSEILALIAAATAPVDGPNGVLGRALLRQTWRQDFSCFSTSALLRLSLAPLINVVSISYLSGDGTRQTIDPQKFITFTDATSPVILPAEGYTWPITARHPASVQVTYVAGYGAPADVPAPIRHAILLLVGQWYAVREAGMFGGGSEIPFGVSRLLQPYRRVP